MKNNIHLKYFFLIIVLSLLSFANHAKAAAIDNVYGQAWSSTVGWIKLNNCTDPLITATCTGQPFGVTIDLAGNVSGAGWSNNIGWVKFVTSNNSLNCPSGPCNAKYYPTAVTNHPAGSFSGWAIACSAVNNQAPNPTSYNPTPNQTAPNNTCGGLERNDGWDGWISLGGNAANGQAYGINLNKGTGVGSGKAWGADVVGWVDFSQVHLVATTPVVGQCGSATTTSATSAPTTNLCANSTTLKPPGVSTGPGPWTWTCAGLNGGADSPLCTASVAPSNGACNPASIGGPFTTAPTNLCANNGGTPSPSTLPASGPWNWQCIGSGIGHTDANCSATQTPGAPTCTLEAYVNSSPTSTAASTQTFYLGWTGTNLATGATNCTINGGNLSNNTLTSYPAPVNGIAQVFTYPTNPNPKTYTISCLGSNNTQATCTKTVTISQNPPTPYVSLIATPSSYADASAASANPPSLSWTAGNVSTCKSVSNPNTTWFSNNRVFSGAELVNINKSTTFGISCIDSNNITVHAQASVQIGSVTPPADPTPKGPKKWYEF